LNNWLKYTLPFILISSFSFSQSNFERFFTPSDSLNTQRRNAVVISEGSLIGLALLGLDQLWYNDFERSKFHTINDNSEWLQMDKLGHVLASYQLGKIGANVLNWSGVGKKDQLLYGATLGFAFLTTVEVFDGYSKEWGFSWGDMVSNALGTGLYVGQELLWKEQRITLKYSFHQTKYAPLRPDKLGSGFLEEMLKDYNGQTYWISANIHAFFKQTDVPRWFNVAFGYGADGLLSGNNEPNNQDFTDHRRIRQFYLSFDIDFSRISVKSGLLRVFFDVINVLKMPFPALEFNNYGTIKLHSIYF